MQHLCSKIQWYFKIPPDLPLKREGSCLMLDFPLYQKGQGGFEIQFRATSLKKQSRATSLETVTSDK